MAFEVQWVEFRTFSILFPLHKALKVLNIFVRLFFFYARWTICHKKSFIMILYLKRWHSNFNNKKKENHVKRVRS